MVKKYHRSTLLVPQVTLEIEKGGLINTCSIQPLISEGGFVRKSHVIFSSRVPDLSMPERFNHRQSVAYKKRVEGENSIITENTVSYNRVQCDILKTMWENGKHYSLDTTVSRWRALKFRLEYMRCCTLGSRPSFLLTSDPELGYGGLPTPIKIFRVKEKFLPKNVLIMGIHNQSVYANPIVACPIIPKERLDEFCLDNGIDTSTITFNKHKKYPFIEMQLDWYEIYQHYLNHVGTDEWYLEVFKDWGAISDYYSIIHLKN